MNGIPIKNNQAVALAEIPEIKYQAFFDEVSIFMNGHPERHCVNYYGFPDGSSTKLLCCIADDAKGDISLLSTRASAADKLPSLTNKFYCFEKFEREIHENFGIGYTDHPWLKPVRYPYNRHDKAKTMDNYPFFAIDSEELHEVGVGPIHAGVIEPGHFRFICNGEQILHLEIQLGYQHRGIEQLMLEKKNLAQLSTLAETIAGDTAVGHATCFAQVWESLCGFNAPEDVHHARTLALELERMAIHTGDLSAVCTDIAYQLGSAVFGRLRTPIVNYMQEWCGNRLSKGLIRPGHCPYPHTDALAKKLREMLIEYERDFSEMCTQLFKLSSALSRLERTGVVSYDEVLSIGAVGMSARMSGLERDIRKTHPHALYPSLNHVPVVKHHGDVYSRVQIRREEIKQSIGFARTLTENLPVYSTPASIPEKPKPSAFTLSLVEGWRGEICHCAITDEKGRLRHYKIKDPSFHNWLALALAVRNNEISDFPICNKSFNLSYCGHDL